MPLMSWNDNLSVGVKVLDDDHKKLIGLLNELHDGITGGQRQEALGHVLHELITYTKTHFQREEELFARTGYPEAAAHKKEHDSLVQKAVDLQNRFKQGGTSMLSLETMSFLKSWLTQHIQGNDKKYSSHLKSKGVQ